MLDLNKENENYQHLVDEAEGAFLKKEYLEAFLIQSCVIEGVIKNYAAAKLDIEISRSGILRDKFENFELGRLIDDLFLAGKITPELYEGLDSYRKKRNKVIHELLKYTDKRRLDGELKEAYERGRHMKGFIVEDLRNEIRPGVSTAEIMAQLEAQIVALMVQLEALAPGSLDAMVGKVRLVLSKDGREIGTSTDASR